MQDKKDSTNNRIDGFNFSRGEGLPYSESPAKSVLYTSATLLARHGSLGVLNNVNGFNSSRGEGAPYAVSAPIIEEVDINIEETTLNSFQP
jgi:hypothetical protein